MAEPAREPELDQDTARRLAAWRFLGHLFRRERWGVAAAVASGLVWQAAAVLGPLLVKEAIDDGILGGDRRALYTWALAILGVGVIEATAWGSRHYFAIRNGMMRADAAVRDGLFAHAQRLDARQYDRIGPGDLMSRASSDSLLVARVLDNSGHTVGYLLTVVAVATIMLVLQPGLALIVLLPLPLLSLGVWGYSARYAEPSKALQHELAAAATLAEETISGVRVVKGLGAGRALAERFRRISDSIVDRALAVARIDATFFPALELVPLVGVLAVLWFGGNRVLDGAMTMGEFVAFNAYVLMLVWPLRTLGQRVQTVQRGLAASERITEVLDAQPVVVEPEEPRRLDGRPARGEVRFRGVTFGYEAGDPVLDGLDLHVPAGSSLALVGRTGSGKTTLAALLARFYDVDDGAVLVDGTDVRDFALTELRRAIGIVFEETFLFSDTVRANIAFARHDADDAEIERAARLAGAHEFIVRLPEGYDTVLGERGFSLSGGQRQRIAIARTVLADPAVLVLDDATSAVDATMEHEIRAALATIMRGRTTLVIAHRPATIALAARVALLERGRIVDLGTHEELVARSESYRRLLALDEEAW